MRFRSVRDEPEIPPAAVAYARNMTWDLGRRLRETRLRLGKTQQEVAGGIVSAAFLSMVESGRREPSQEVLSQLLERLGLDATALHDCSGISGLLLIRTALARAEMLVATSEFSAALRELDAIDRLFTGIAEPDLRTEFHYWRGRALAGLAKFDSAIRELTSAQDAASVRGATVREIEAGTELLRCLCNRGDLSAALELLSRLQAKLPDANGGSPLRCGLLEAAIRLFVLRGDDDRARDAAAQASACLAPVESPALLGQTLSRASLAAEASDDSSAALVLATEAVRLQHSRTDAANRGRLHTAIAHMHTRVTPPDLDSAVDELQAARAALGSGAAGTDLAAVAIEDARVQCLRGDYAAALASSAEVQLELADGTHAQLLAHAHVLAARAHARLGQIEPSRLAFQQAQRAFGTATPLRSTAVAWRELGDTYLGVGMADDAVMAYQLALSDAGLAAAPKNSATLTGSTPAAS